MEDSAKPSSPSEEEGLEKGFLKTEAELPAFEEQELLGEKRAEDKAEQGYEQLPFSVVHKIIRATCLVALVVWFILIVILSIITKSDPFYTLLGLSPVLMTIIITYILVDKYHLESGFLMVFPFIFTGILFVLGEAHLLNGMDYRTLSSVNIIFGLLFEMIIIIHYAILRRKRRIKASGLEEQEDNKEKKPVIKLDDENGLKSFISSIEDKLKAINAAIGRVYSIRHGGTESLRKKIKVDALHYNEFNQLRDEPPENRREIAVRLLRKIRDRLELLQKPEKEVFDKDELSSLLNITRDPQGKDKVIDVIIRNDKDPVKAYYDGALEFCNTAIKRLEEENKKRS